MISPLSEPEIIAHLERNIVVRTAFDVKADKKDRAYIGNINGSEFHLKRHIEYRNPFLPKIQGKVSNSKHGSKVLLNFEMNKATYHAFNIVTIGVILISTLIMLVKETLFGLIPITAFLSIYGLGLLIFYKGVQTSKKHFLQITKGTINKISY